MVSRTGLENDGVRTLRAQPQQQVVRGEQLKCFVTLPRRVVVGLSSLIAQRRLSHRAEIPLSKSVAVLLLAVGRCGEKIEGLRDYGARHTPDTLLLDNDTWQAKAPVLRATLGKAVQWTMRQSGS